MTFGENADGVLTFCQWTMISNPLYIPTFQKRSLKERHSPQPPISSAMHQQHFVARALF